MFPKRFSNAIPSLILLLCSLFSATALHPSPKAEADLICHTNHASDCYPRTFQPTRSFQIVHDDQNLPPGLHIRMNLATGVKEAKLNEPDEETVENAADLVVIDDIRNEAPALHDQTQSQHVAHALQDQTKPQLIQPPRPPHFDSSEGALFSSSASTLKSSPLSEAETLLPALSDLQDLAHSSHWGVSLTRDSTICRLLLQLLAPPSALSTVDIELRSAAALLLGTAIHNNPDALTAALSHFYNDEWSNGPLEAVILALAHEQLPTLLTRMMFLLSGLCQDETQMRKFLDGGGLDLLASIYDAPNAGADDRDRLRGKISNFILDHFLQMDADAKELQIINQDTKKQMISPELQSQLDNEDSWVKLETGGEEQAKSADLDTNCGELKHNLKQWCSQFELSSTNMKTKADVDSTTASALENIHGARLALDKKLELCGCGCNCLQENCQ